MKPTRPYTMTARARATERTRTRILDATAELAGERLVADISLELVAQRAEVSVQTVLRHFGTRAGLFDATTRYAQGRIVEERRAPVGDVAAAVRALVDHYELRGDAVLLMLAQEGTDPLMASVTASGKRLHREWVETTFAPHLTDPDGSVDPGELVDLLVVATDVYTWKLLRRDRGHGRARTEQRIRRLVEALLPGDFSRERVVRRGAPVAAVASAHAADEIAAPAKTALSSTSGSNRVIGTEAACSAPNTSPGRAASLRGPPQAESCARASSATVTPATG